MVQEPGIAILVGIGLASGIVSGIFGIGGGIIIVPALVYLAGFSQHTATGTSLAILLPPVGLGAVMEYYRHGSVDFRSALVVALCLFIGAWAAAHFSTKIPDIVLRLAFGVFMVLLGIYIIAGSARKLPL